MSATNPTKTKVLIVGAGPGGLTLGILLERAGIDYLLLERTPSIRPLGSAIALSSVVQPVLAQVGLLEEIHEHSKPVSGMTILEEAQADQGDRWVRGDRGVIGTLSNVMPGSDTKERYGYYTRVLPRPTFYNILLKEIPRARLLLNKKVVSFEEYESKSQATATARGGGGDAGGVMVKCADGSEYHAQILVGADGAYSTIRNTLYSRLKAEKKLPKQDQLPLKLKQHCVLGVTEPLTTTPEEEERYRACFEDGFSNFKIVLSKDRKYMLVPFSGEGGAQAILDAVTLANALYDVPTTSVPDLTTAFKSYYDDRYPVALDAIEFSKSLAGVFNRQGWVGDLVRKIALGNTPAFAMRKLDDKLNDKRPQAIFLDFVQVPGLVKPRAQIRSKRQRGEGPLASMVGFQKLASVPETL
ncbi:hypothetical protein KVV02_005808 [Mortierella alpina]|uniref:FAD-binding domain-containing protein n=1 Tax=Mortierella alpina TaxID=64518 RepID=A0A9P8ABB9_MORAP|nr:hypothetical protein KVV02_005808 [Mortierella alpina]